MHWADRRASVAVPDPLSDARMAGIGAKRKAMFAIGSFRICPIPALLRISCGFFSPFCGCPSYGARVWSERVYLVGT